MNTTLDAEAKTLRIERDFRAPIEKVFEALVNPDYASQWWGPEGIEATIHEMDAREGGRYHIAMKGEENTYIVQGVFQVVARPSRLVYTWGWVEDGVRGHETIVEICLTKIEGGTRLNLVHALFESIEDRDAHSDGWSSTFVCLDTYLKE